jgi:imidazolonepropionase-like amidohydrolase
MKRFLICSAILAALAAPTRGEDPNALVLAHVAVIDASGGPPRDNVTIVVQGDRITAVDPSAKSQVPAGAQVVDARGKFVMPGLWDMHVHLSWAKQSALPALVANGVTSVRDAGGDLEEIDLWRRQIRDGRISGPRILRCGSVVDGPKPGSLYRLTVTNEAEARQAVRTLKKQGVDFIKIHNAVPREAYFALADEARRAGIKFAGHIPKTIGLMEACQAGQNSIEHMDTLAEGVLASEAAQKGKSLVSVFQEFAKTSGPELIKCLAARGSAVTPTLIRTATALALMETRKEDDPRAKYLSDFARRRSDQFYPLTMKIPDAEVAERRKLFNEFPKFVLAMQRAGVILLAGTDLAGRGIYPGFSLHDELALLVAAGLTPLEAIQSATLNPARYFGLEADLGSIASGKIADLVLLDASPLDDIRNTTRIRAVVIGGRYLPRDELDTLLRKAETAARD